MIRILCLGKIKEDYLKDFISDYANRIRKYHKLEIIELKDCNDLKMESNELMGYLSNKDYVITLEIEGQSLSSVELARKIDNTFNTYPNITFVIGSSLGLDDSIKKRANYALSFSSLTFPHGVFRALLLEQIYRAFKIINNESYHK